MTPPPRRHHCPLINPLCPDDLCQLPAGHEGTNIGVHLLCTMAEPEMVRLPLAVAGTSVKRLIEMGWEIQDDETDPFWRSS